MKKILTLIMVLGLACSVQASMGPSLNDNCDNFAFAATSNAVTGLPAEGCSIYVVYLEPTAGGQNLNAAAWSDNIRLLPDPETIALLGIAGLLYRKRKAPATVVSAI